MITCETLASANSSGAASSQRSQRLRRGRGTAAPLATPRVAPIAMRSSTLSTVMTHYPAVAIFPCAARPRCILPITIT